MATYAELKQLYTTIHDLSGAAISDGERIWDRMRAISEESESASTEQLAAFKTEYAQLLADNTTRKETFGAGDWVGKMTEFQKGFQALPAGDERAELEKLYVLENTNPKKILGMIKDGIEMSKQTVEGGIQIRESKLKLQPQPTAPAAASSQTASPPGASSTPLNATLATPTAGEVVSRATNEATASGQSIKTSGLEADAVGGKSNPLHSYASYTYGLSLHLLTPDDYNLVVEKPGEYVAKHVLVASAGRWNEKTDSSAMGRDPEFGDDFYFSSLRMFTMIGVGESNRSTNAIDISFTLIEPYGLTFLDRLIAASDAVKSTNYLANPYLLQIDFFGYDDEGQNKTPIPNLTKRIPINFLGLTAKVTTSGAEYQIQAMPFSHQAFTDSAVSTPISVEITAGTVAGFFKATSKGTANLEAILKDQRAESDPTKPLLFTTSASTGGSGATAVTSKDQLYSAKSYADALNAHMIKLEIDRKMLLSDRYDFVFDSTIGESPLYADAATAAVTEAPMGDPAKTKDSQQGGDSSYLNQKQRKYTIQQGSSIDSVLTTLIKNSNYLTKQLVIRENRTNEQFIADKKANEDKFLKWFKVIPKITLRGFDTQTNTFAKNITYHIIPYEMPNVRSEEAPQGKATKNKVSKNYQYIYTGLNADILDLNIEFNAMYYTARSTYKSNLLTTAGTDAYNNKQGVGNATENVSDVAPSSKKSITPTVVKYKGTDQRYIASGGSKTPEEISAADLLSSIFAQSVADMLQVDLKIIGDPDFIKQDDLFYAPTYNANGEVQVADRVPNGSISTDTGEIYVELVFKTPMDIDDETGLMKYDAKYQASGFSGLYRIISVESVFESGKFTQNLVLIRYPDQDGQKEKEKAKEERAETSANAAESATTPVDQVTDTSTTTKPTDGNDVTGKPKPETTNAAEKVDPALKAVKENGETQPITSPTTPSTTTPEIPPNEPVAIAPVTAQPITPTTQISAATQAQIADLEAQLAAAQATGIQARADRVALQSQLKAAEGTSQYAGLLAQYNQAEARYDTAYRQVESLRSQIAALKK